MAGFQINGVDVTAVNLDGQEVTEVQLDGSTVWTSELPDYDWHETQKFNLSITTGLSVGNTDTWMVVGVATYRGEYASSGIAYVYENVGGTWTYRQDLVAPTQSVNLYFGNTVALTDTWMLIGAPRDATVEYGGGSSYVFENVGGTWTYRQKLTADIITDSSYFGFGLDLTDSNMVISAYQEPVDVVKRAGALYTYENVGGTWTYRQRIVSSTPETTEYYGQSIKMTDNWVIAGRDAYGGSAYIYENVGGTWTNEQILYIEGSSRFGYGIALTDNWCAVSDYSFEKFYIYENVGGTWTNVQTIQGSGGEFAKFMDMTDEWIIAGIPNMHTNNYNEGAVAIYNNNDGVWGDEQIIYASTSSLFEEFGNYVSITDNWASVGTLTIGNLYTLEKRAVGTV